MRKLGLYLLALLAVIVISIGMIPAFAEVTSLKTSSTFYKGGSTIYFSGTVLPTDPPNVTILVFDPTNKFVLLASGNADSSHQFQVSVDTSSASGNQQKFALKGTYNATAFIANKQSGQTVSFVFSPDGSPIAPSQPTSLTAQTISPTEIDLNWAAPANAGGPTPPGYQIGRSADGGTTWSTSVTVIQSTSFADTGLTPNTSYMYRVYAVNSGGTSPPSNVIVATTLAVPSPPTTQGTTSTGTNPSSAPSLEDLLKQRLADAQRLQALLHGGNPSPSSSSAQTVKLNETMSVNDASDQGIQKSTTGQGNGSTQNGIPNISNLVIYPIISLVGAGIVIFILYLKRKQNPSSDPVKEKSETIVQPEEPTNQDDGDKAMMILKTRLAKGEITLDEFKELKDELAEP